MVELDGEGQDAAADVVGAGRVDAVLVVAVDDEGEHRDAADLGERRGVRQNVEPGLAPEVGDRGRIAESGHLVRVVAIYREALDLERIGHREHGDSHLGRGRPISIPDTWHLLAQYLTVARPWQTPLVEDAVGRLADTGCTAFEAIVGTPWTRYGPRVTFAPPAGRDAEVARELGFADHPWGPPTWYGLRFRDGGSSGRLGLKPYHRTARLPAGLRLPAGMPDGLVVDVSALSGNAVEVYFRRVVHGRWADFAVAAAALVDAGPPSFAPAPRDVRGAHCVSPAAGPARR